MQLCGCQTIVNGEAMGNPSCVNELITRWGEEKSHSFYNLMETTITGGGKSFVLFVVVKCSNLNRAVTAENLDHLSQNSIALFNSTRANAPIS